MIMKKFIFVLMPFNSDFDDIYQLGIKEISKEFNVYIERVDEQIYEGSMLDRIYNQIHNADIIIADLSQKNPNVFYEVGYAHALNKRVILITQDGNDIPFDMKHFYHIIYNKNNIYELKTRLTERILWNLNNSEDEKNLAFPFDVFVNDVKLNDQKETEVVFNLKECEYNQNYIYQGVFYVSLVNNSFNIYRDEMMISLIVPRDFPQISYDDDFVFAIPNNKKKMGIAGVFGATHPDQWNGRYYTVNWVADKPLEKQYSGILDLSGYYSFLKFPIKFKINIEDELSSSIAKSIYESGRFSSKI